MASRLSRAWVPRAAVAAAAFALPLLGAGAAQAAIAGATPEKTTNRPDLISATIISGSSVDFCFDKTVANPPAGGGGFIPGDFLLGGYRAENAHAANVANLEQNSSGNTPPFNCVRAAFPGAAGDLDKYTIGTVVGGAVLAEGGNVNNLDDSTPLTKSTTHNGTTNFTAAPDLTGVLVDTTVNTITYVEDQAIGSQPVAGTFFFTDAGGNSCLANGTTPHVSGNEVTVSFNGANCFSNITNGGGVNPVPTETVSNAVRAGQQSGQVVPPGLTAANDPNATNTDDEVAVPNAPNSGLTGKPDLTKVALESNGQAMDFTFDDNVTASGAGLSPACFRADLSTGDEVGGTNANVISVSTTSTTLRVVFPNLAFYDEYVVKGSVIGGCAVQSSAGGTSVATNTPGSGAAGDNAGAFARGFTTGPDVFAAVLNKTTGVASVALDQRAFGTANPGNIMLVDPTGNVIAAANGAQSVTFPSQAAGPETITVQFTPGQVANAKNMAFENSNDPTPNEAGSAFESFLGEGNVSQILSTTTTASMLSASKLAAKHANVNHKAQARAKARLRAASRARLAKLRKAALRHKRHHRHH